MGKRTESYNKEGKMDRTLSLDGRLGSRSEKIKAVPRDATQQLSQHQVLSMVFSRGTQVHRPPISDEATLWSQWDTNLDGSISISA